MSKKEEDRGFEKVTRETSEEVGKDSNMNRNETKKENEDRSLMGGKRVGRRRNEKMDWNATKKENEGRFCSTDKRRGHTTYTRWRQWKKSPSLNNCL